MKMTKATSIKDAIAQWEKATGEDASMATIVQLQLRFPPIEKMDNNLSKLVACEMLSLSSNMIDRIVGVASMTNLKVLSLARNHIKSLNGIDGVKDTLEQLWISYNNIEKLAQLESFTKLSVLYISHNLIRDWSEISKLGGIGTLADMSLLGNPVEENNDEPTYRREITKRLKYLKKIDGDPILRMDD